MQNPYDNDADANKALISGQSASAALGFPEQNPQAGLRTPQRIMADARQRVDALSQQVMSPPATPKREPVVGYDRNTDTIFSAGKQFDYKNLSMLDQADKAGYLDFDNTDKLPAGVIPVPVSQVRAYLQNKAKSRGALSAAGEIGQQVLMGLPDTINMGVRAGQFFAPAGSGLESALRDTGDAYEAGAAQYTPDVYGRGEVSSAMIKGGRSLVPSVAAGTASLAAPVVGTGVAGGVFFGSQATDTYEEGLRQGLTQEAAKAAALKTGAIEAGGELLGDRLGVGLLTSAGKMAGKVGLGGLGYGKRVAVDLLANAGVQAGTEFGQGYAQAAVEQNAGIGGVDPMDAGIEGAKVGLGMSALMAPFGAAVGYANRPRDLLEPAPVQESPAPSTALAPYAPPAIPTPVQDVTPEAQFGFGYGGPALLPPPTPAAPVNQENAPGTIYVTPGGTATGDTRALTGLQGDMFGGAPDTFGEAPAAPIEEQTAPTQDTQTGDMFADSLVANVPVDFGASALAREMAGTGKRSPAIEFLARDLAAALGTPAVQQLIERINNTSRWKGRNIPTEVVERANEIVARFEARQQDAQGQEQVMRTNQMAQQGQQRAQPGVVIGQRPDNAQSAQIAMEESAARQAPAPAAEIPVADQIADVDAAAEARRAQESAAERRQILDRILADPTTANPAGRFTATLKKLGYRETKVSADEAAAIQRHAEITAALADADTVVSTPNEMDVESLVPERKAKGAQPAPRRVNPQLTKEFELTSYTADDIAALDAAKAKRARKEAAPAAEETTAPEGKQTQLWDKAGRITPAANVNKAPVEAKAPAPTPEPTPVLPPKRAKLKLPKDAAKQAKPTDLTNGVQEAPAEKPPVTNEDVTANTENVELDVARIRVAKAIEDAYDADQIDSAQYAELGDAYNNSEISTPALRKMLSTFAMQTVGIARAKYRTGSGGNGMKSADVRGVIDWLLTRWRNAPEIEVVQSERDLPNSIQEDLKENPPEGPVKGVFKDGKVYIVADNHTSSDDVMTTAFHEVAGHYGLKGIFGDKLTAEMQRLYNGNVELRALASARREAGMTLEVAMEEVLAELQESTKGRAGLMTKVLDFFRSAFARLLGKEIVTMSEVSEILARAADFVENGAPTDPGQGGDKAKFRSAREAVRDIAGDLKYDKLGSARRGILSATFLRDIGERFAGKFSRVKEYVDTVFKMGASAGAMQEEAIKIQDILSALPRAEHDKLMDFMGRVTFANVSIDKTYGEKDTKFKEAEALQTEFATFSAAQKAAYRAARDALAKNWKVRADLLSRTANEVYDPLIEDARAAGNLKVVRRLQAEKQEYLRDINARLAAIEGDYFPMMRFGDYAVVRKSSRYVATEKAAEEAFKKLNALLDKFDKKSPEDRKIDAKRNEALRKAGAEPIDAFTPEQDAEIKAARAEYNELTDTLEGLKSRDDDYYVAQYETEAQARADQRANGGYVTLRREYAKEMNPINRQMLSRLEDAMAVTLKGKGNVTAMRDAKRAMFEVYLSSLPELSALKRQARRKNVAGWHKDMQRNIASSMLKDSFYLSRMEHMDDLNAALNSVREEADEKARRGEPDAVKMQEVAAELERRQVASMQYHETPLQDFASALSYVYFLGVSPGFLFANLMQPFMVSAPMLAARHGLKTARFMGNAYKDVAALVTKSLKGNWRGELDFEKSALPENEKGLLRHLLQQRLLSVTLTHDLAATADGKTGSRFMRALSLPSHHVEVMNRVGTALAAYRMEMAANGGNSVKAMEYAQKVLADTHFDYSTENAPYFMKPGVVPLGKLLFQFKKYQVGMLSLYTKIIAASFKGATAKERSEAKLNLLGLLATHGMVAGALGMPAAGALLFIANMVQDAFGDDEDWDAEIALRNWLHDKLGKEAGTAVAKGLPTLLGADLSAKLGVGNLLSIVPMMRESDTARGMYAELLLSLAGPALGGLLPRFADGVQFMHDGQFTRATEAFMPKFIADVVRSGRFATEGVKTRSGDTMRADVSVWDAFLTASGISPVAVADMYAANAAIKGRESSFMDQSKRVTREWADAKPEDRREIEDRIRQEVNPQRVAAGLKPITRGDLFRYQLQRNRRNASYEAVGANVSRRSGEKMGEVGRFAKE